MKRLFLTLLFLWLFSLLYAESATSLLSRADMELGWEPFRKEGVFYDESTHLEFRTGEQQIRVNGQWALLEQKVEERNGQPWFSEKDGETILAFFNVREDLTADDSYSMSVILIDPGHGGSDPGTYTTWEKDGMTIRMDEKNVVLDIALRLYEKLKKEYPDKKILMTRYDDSYPTLEERVKMANSFSLDNREGMIYLSLHANAGLNKLAKGYEIFHLPEDYRRTIVDEDEEDNDTVLPVLNLLWEEALTQESVLLADSLLAGFDATIGSQTENRGKKSNTWFVVKNKRMASVLVEVGFLSNSEEAARLRDPAYLQQVSEGLYNGLQDFISNFESREIF